MILATAATTFAIILPAELPDKTMLACVVMGSRYRPGFVFAGVAAAFAVHAALAVALGGLLGLLPRAPLHVIVGVMFAIGAVILLRQRRPETGGRAGENGGRAGFLPAAGTGFAVILAAEFGDLTQIITANLAATYHDPVAVGIGSALALWGAAGLAIAGGQGLLKIVPVTWLSRAAGLVMLALAGTSLAASLT
ncbi:MAG: TMEM165/GDT1 family protein [Micromonosporaceae bacterium]